MNSGEYKSLLNKIERECPDHPLLPQLREGHSEINELYIEHAAGDIQMMLVKNRKKQRKATTTLKDLYRQARNILGRMGRESNKFHACKSDAERAAISDRLQLMHAEVAQLYRQGDNIKADPAAAEHVNIVSSGQYAKMVLERQTLLNKIRYRRMAMSAKNATPKMKERHERIFNELSEQEQAIAAEINRYLRSARIPGSD